LFRVCTRLADNLLMDARAIAAAAAASAAGYRSFADATRAVLDLLAHHLPDATLFLAHLDRGQGLHRVVDTRNGPAFGVVANTTMPIAESLCGQMAAEGLVRRIDDLKADPVYGRLPAQRRYRAGAYLGVALELSDGSRVASLAALAGDEHRFGPEHEQLFGMLARVLVHELERETNRRDLRRMNDSIRDQARGMAALARVGEALATLEDARPAICQAACEIGSADLAILLEPRAREFASTASSDPLMTPMRIQARRGSQHPFHSSEAYFVARAGEHPALSEALIQATGARSALFQPVLRDERVTGVLVLIWRQRREGLSEPVANLVRVLAVHAAAAVEHASLAVKLERLAVTDELTGLPTRRVFEEEVRREIARSRRSEAPMSVAVADLDHLTVFNAHRGDGEGDRLLKETAALWAAQLREVDMIARVDGGEFGILLPGCELAEACRVLDRVRATTPRGQTASAGVARWDGFESVEQLTERARGALAAAKVAGRDSTTAAE
jgi:diguanylate cyclase (GGDEF)-like protein